MDPGTDSGKNPGKGGPEGRRFPPPRDDEWGDEAISTILEGVLHRVRPSPGERDRLRETAEDILSMVDELARMEGVDCRGILVGSAARDTCLSGDHDLDVFLAVPPEVDLGDALRLARQIAPVHEEKYAEHAYIHAVIDGFDVDLVPCFRLENATRIKSAVDRTPFHTKYVCSRIPGREDQVLLLKQFMKGVGVYGSELRVGGFSGYLAELLVLRYGSFLEVLRAVTTWRPGETIDLEGHSKVSREDPLIVVDPVDPRRNVAAALSLDRMFQFVSASRCFLKVPSERFFFPPEGLPLSDEELLSWLLCRGTCTVLLEFDAPSVVEDVLFPQLRKAEAASRALLKRNGFSVLRSDVTWYGERAGLLDMRFASRGGEDGGGSDVHRSGIDRLGPGHEAGPGENGLMENGLMENGLLEGNGSAGILLELEVWELPDLKRHVGPPIWEKAHLEKFLASHEPISGPYVEAGRAVVEVPRRYKMAVELLKERFSGLSLGRHISRQVRSGYRVHVGEELLRIDDRDFRVFLREFFEARMPIC